MPPMALPTLVNDAEDGDALQITAQTTVIALQLTRKTDDKGTVKDAKRLFRHWKTLPSMPPAFRILFKAPD